MAAAQPEVTVPLGKPQGDFRVYEESGGVYEHYKAMRANQSLAFSQRMTAQWSAFGSRPGGRMTVKQALALCDTFCDRSDPDTLMPNSIHMLQAAEACRAAGKPAWFQLCALLHDIGKLMYKWGRCEDGQGGRATDPQWALGGDTWVVGAPIPDCAVYPKLNALSPDRDADFQATPTGIYKPGCGMMNLQYAFGHDEYAYRAALHNKIKLPAEGLAILRLHSCYPWHTGKAYRELMAPGDEALEAAVIEFNQVRPGVRAPTPSLAGGGTTGAHSHAHPRPLFPTQYDLYTKASAVPVLEECWPHYQAIIDELCPGELDW